MISEHPSPSPRSLSRSAARGKSFARHPQFLLVADETALAPLEAAIASLPLCAAGRIFIEVAEPEQVSVIAAPSRMSVTWLVRSERSGEMGSGRGCSRGQAASRAVAAWCSEMFPAVHEAPEVIDEIRFEVQPTVRADEAVAAALPLRTSSPSADAAVVLSSAWLGGDYRTVSAAYETLVDESGVAADLVDTPADFALRRR